MKKTNIPKSTSAIIMSLGFFRRKNEDKTPPEVDGSAAEKGSADVPALMAWCKRNRGSSTTARRLLELADEDWNFPKSDTDVLD